LSFFLKCRKPGLQQICGGIATLLPLTPLFSLLFAAVASNTPGNAANSRSRRFLAQTPAKTVQIAAKIPQTLPYKACFRLPSFVRFCCGTFFVLNDLNIYSLLN
jgi:hypothetical protein